MSEVMTCDYCARNVLLTHWTTVYSYSRVGERESYSFCSESCREDHKSQPRYTLTDLGRAALEKK